MPIFVIACLIFSFLIFSFPATAVETIVITAGRIAQTVEDTLAPVIVIEREEIEQSEAANAAELVSQHAAIGFSRPGGIGQASSLFFRGTESNHTLVLVDGVKINPGTLGMAPLYNLPLAFIERVEIVKGPHSSLYGSEAVGGVINIITRRAPLQDGAMAEGILQTGSYETHSASATAGWRQAQQRAGITFNWLDSQGFSPRVESDLACGHQNTGVNLYGGGEWQAIDFELSHLQTQGNTEYLDYTLSPLDQDFTNTVTAFTMRTDLTPAWQTKMNLSYVTDKIDQNQSADFAETKRTTVDWQNNLPGDIHWLTAGLTASWEETASLVYGSGYREDTQVNAVFVQDNIHYGSHQFLAAARYTDHQAFGGHFTGNLAYSMQWRPETRWLASAGTAFRAPDSTDRFGFGGNPELQPETATHLELGLRQRVGANQTLEFNAFQTKLQDLINFNDPDGYTGPVPGRNENIDRAKIRGLEAIYHLPVAPWSFNLEFLYQDPRNQITEETLARRAKERLTVSFAYQQKNYRLGLQLLAEGMRRDSDFNEQRLGGYTTADVTAHYQLNAQWRLEMHIVNLFDKNYETAGGYETGGRMWQVSGRV